MPSHAREQHAGSVLPLPRLPCNSIAGIQVQQLPTHPCGHSCQSANSHFSRSEHTRLVMPSGCQAVLQTCTSASTCIRDWEKVGRLVQGVSKYE